ncbi:MAG: 2-oxoacid:acceptor oxidoreductase subunit alpha [Gammaproteobacteria bacterium]|nr:MAG: 2-oxoacid:acceptor oxidoreductase subunit alpha [Gammaproteobacteria bacterium]
MSKSDLIIRVAGEGGEGVISAGDFIAAACARAGLEVYTFKTFPAEIRGGYAMYQTRVSDNRIYNQGDTFDVFCAFNGEAYEMNKHLLKPGIAFVYDAESDFQPEEHEGVHTYPITMSKTAKEIGSKQAKNLVALGALSELFNIQKDVLWEVISNKFASKGDDVQTKNRQAFEKGMEQAKALTKADEYKVADPKETKDVIVISGNDAVGLGAILGKLDFFSAYPITPATEIAKYVSAQIPKTGGTLIQAEDEIASIAQVLGASYGGARSMTATSGPGVALMGEMIGMSAMSETPALIVDVQRGGPSTGMPTKHEQSDLMIAINGGHGDCPRVVMAVEDVADCIYMTVEALNITEEYQIPVLLLTDGSLAFSTQTVPTPDPAKIKIVERKRWNGEGEYKRYELTEDGISSMCDPGTPGGMHIGTGLEHNEKGAPFMAPANRQKMQDKRFNKTDRLLKEYKAIEIDGNPDAEAEIGIITWGSTIGVVREAVARLNAEGISAKGFYPKLIWPMPAEQYEAFASKCKKILVPEVNYLGQLSHFIRAETSIQPIPYTICGGLPFNPAMIVEKAKEVI